MRRFLPAQAFGADPALASEAAAVIAASYRERADAGDVEALVELGDFLYWDEPEAARAVFQEAIEAGHPHAMINLARLLLHVLDDEESALAVLERAAASADADLSAEAMYEIAFVHVSQRDAAGARAVFERVIGTRHPVWAAAAMVGLAGVLTRRDDPEGAVALYREAVEAGDAGWAAHASCLLGDLLEGKGDIAGARAARQRVIDSRSPEWAGPAFTGLVNLLGQQEDADGLRAAYLDGAALGNPDALYALLQLGQLLEAQGDVAGAHTAWRQAIDAGCQDAGYWRERMSPAPAREPETRVYPPGLPPEFNPLNMLRTGLDVLEHGLPPLPEVLTHEMALPIAYWTAEQCAVVLFLRFSRHGHDEPMPVAMKVTYSRGEDGRWEPPAHVLGSGFSHDPVRSPGSTRDLDGNPMVYGGSSQTREVTPGRPAFVAAGRAAPEVKYLAVIKDGHEDRRPLESHFGAWVVCTEQPGSFDVAGLDATGTVLASLPHSFRPPSLRPGMADERVAELRRLIDGPRRNPRTHPYHGRREYSDHVREVTGHHAPGSVRTTDNAPGFPLAPEHGRTSRTVEKPAGLGPGLHARTSEHGQIPPGPAGERQRRKYSCIAKLDTAFGTWILRPLGRHDRSRAIAPQIRDVGDDALQVGIHLDLKGQMAPVIPVIP